MFPLRHPQPTQPTTPRWTSHLRTAAALIKGFVLLEDGLFDAPIDEPAGALVPSRGAPRALDFAGPHGARTSILSGEHADHTRAGAAQHKSYPGGRRIAGARRLGTPAPATHHCLTPVPRTPARGHAPHAAPRTPAGRASHRA